MGGNSTGSVLEMLSKLVFTNVFKDNFYLSLRMLTWAPANTGRISCGVGKRGHLGDHSGVPRVPGALTMLLNSLKIFCSYSDLRKIIYISLYFS